MYNLENEVYKQKGEYNFLKGEIKSSIFEDFIVYIRDIEYLKMMKKFNPFKVGMLYRYI